MFDKLNEIKEAWAKNENVKVVDDFTKYNYYVLPLQIVTEKNFIELDRLTCKNYHITLPFHHFKILGLPNTRSMIQGLGSRYPFVSILLANEDASYQESISLGPLGNSDKLTYEQIAKFLRSFGDMAEELDNRNITDMEYKKFWGKYIKSPGLFRLIQLNYYGLRRSNHISEMSSTLSELAGYGATTIYKISSNSGISSSKEDSPVKDSKIMINTKTILNLWRSIRKIDKKEIDYL